MADRESPNINVGILTVSDSCYNGTATDRSGENLKHLVESGKLFKGIVVTKDIIPDELDQIKAKLLHWSDHLKLDLILTTGGTGFASRDVTPEATKAVLEKEALGLTMAMLKGSLEITPMAMLTRLVCGTRGATLIINLPGSTKGSSECFQIVSVGIPHAVDLLRGHKSSIERTHSALQSEHSHSQLTTGCWKSEKITTKWRHNLDTECVSSQITSGVHVLDPSLMSAADPPGPVLGQAGINQSSSVTLLMWKALLSLPKEARMSLVNSFSSSLSSPLATALQLGQPVGDQPQSHTSAHHVASSSSQPDKAPLLRVSSSSIGHQPVFSVHSSVANVLPCNIQVVRPQIVMNPNSSSTSSGISAQSSTASEILHSQWRSTSWLKSPNRLTATASMTNIPSVDHTLPCTDMSRQRGPSGFYNNDHLDKSNLVQLKMKQGSLSSSLPCVDSFSNNCVSNIAATPSRHRVSRSPLHNSIQVSQSSHCDDYTAAISSPSPQNFGTFEDFDRSDQIYAREIKPPLQTSVHPIVQVFLPCSKHSETNQSELGDRLLSNQKELDSFRSVDEQYVTGLAAAGSLPSQIQAFSDLSDDIEVSVEDTDSVVGENFVHSEEDESRDSAQLHKQRDTRKDFLVNSFHLGWSSHVLTDTSMASKNYQDTHLVNKTQEMDKADTSLSARPSRCHSSTNTKLSEQVPGSIKSAKIHYLKTKGELLYVPVGTPLKSFINEHPLVLGICLHKGKREIKKQLAQLCRQCDSGDRMTSWRRGKEILERNRFDDYFELTEEGRREQAEVLGSRRRDQYVVNWYIWCPGHSNCKRKCGGFGVCVEKCKGMMHKQDRHNCSLMINMKLFLSDLSTWRVNITGSHVPPGSGITWVPPALHGLHFFSSEAKGQTSSKDAVRISPKKVPCQKAGPLSSASLMSDATSDLPAASPSPVKVCRGSAQASKASVCIPSKKRISKMLSSLKRRRQERQSTLKSSLCRREENINVNCGDQEIEHVENSDQPFDGKPFTKSLSKKHLSHNSANIFENLSRQWESDRNYANTFSDNAECHFLSKPLFSTAVSAVENLERASSSDSLISKLQGSDISIAHGLEQPYLNANTLCEILQQANGQDIFDHQASTALAAASCHDDHFISDVIKTSAFSSMPNSEISTNWKSSEVANSDKPLLSAEFGSEGWRSYQLPSSIMCLPHSHPGSSPPYEPLPHGALAKSESEAIASIVQSLCGASDLQTMRAIALHDPMMSQQYKEDFSDEDNGSANLTLLEALPSYQEATASLGHQLHPPNGSDHE